ncbi:MAG: methyltransferase domain-containing protein [Verrucomicrobiota bacterium]
MSSHIPNAHYFLGQKEDSLFRYQLFNEVYQPGTEQVFSWLNLQATSQVLEIGCGIGATALYMAREIVPEGHVTAFDVASDMVDYGKRTAEKLGIANISFHHASAQDFHYAPGGFDLVHTRFVISYLQDAEKIVQNVYRALKPSGHFFAEEIAQAFLNFGDVEWYEKMASWFVQLADLNGGDADYGSTQLARDMRKAGFSIENVGSFVPVKNEPKMRQMLAMLLSNEMRDDLTKLSIATGEEIDRVVARMKSTEDSSQISAVMASQVIGRKPSEN